MYVLFVGGPKHGDAEHVAHDIQSLEVTDALEETGLHRYDKHRWQNSRIAHGFEAVFVSSTVLHSEYEAKIPDAMDLARKSA